MKSQALLCYPLLSLPGPGWAGGGVCVGECEGALPPLHHGGLAAALLRRGDGGLLPLPQPGLPPTLNIHPPVHAGHDR